MHKKIAAARMPAGGGNALFTVYYEDDRPVECDLRPLSEKTLLGAVFTGRVESLRPDMKAAFVRFGENRSGFLPLRSRERFLTGRGWQNELKSGDLVLVQVCAEAQKEKVPRLSASVELAGRCLVVRTGVRKDGFSAQLSEEARASLRKLLSVMRAGMPDESCSVLFRTAAGDADSAEILAEWELLSGKLSRILQTAMSRTQYTCLSAAPDFWQSCRSRCRTGDTLSMVTDDAAVYAAMRDLYDAGPLPGEEAPRLYTDPGLALYRLYRMQALLESLLAKRVQLPSGGSLLVEPTEAFVAIDVNSGRTAAKKQSPEQLSLVNREAADAVMQTVRLRGLSGTILVDFINTENMAEDRFLLERMRELSPADPAKPDVIDFTSLHILQMTRRKTGRPVAEQLRRIRPEEDS